MFVSYSRKGDATCARAVTSRRVDGRVVKETSNLGRVVDRERHVFRSRERGTFTFDPETGEFGPAPAGDWPAPPERMVLDFGDAWALDRLASVRAPEKLVAHGGRYVYVDRAEAELAGGVRGWTYLCVDMQTRGQEQRRLYERAARKGLSPEDVHARTERMGAFVLASTADIPADGVLDAYYARQRIGQVFDVGKNYASLLPVRVQSEEALRGHLLFTFCATALLCRLQSRMPAKSTPMPQALAAVRNQKCKVYEGKVITCEPTAAANELYRAIGATCPVEIPLACDKK